MEADVIINGEVLELHGSVVAMDYEITSKGEIAGYTFHDRTKPEERYVLYAQDGKALLYTDNGGDILSIENKTLQIESIKTQNLSVGAIVSDYEMTSNGKNGGYTFHDRTNTKNRYVLYAKDGKARLYTDAQGDVLTIENKTLQIESLKVEKTAEIKKIKADSIVGKSLEADSVKSKDIAILYTTKTEIDDPFNPGKKMEIILQSELDLFSTIRELQEKVKKLEKKIEEMK